MDPESKKLLEETFRLAEENNRMLKKVRNVQKWAAVWNGVKIFVILGLAIGSFYFLEPYLQSLVDVYSSVGGVETSMTGGGGSFFDFLDRFNN